MSTLGPDLILVVKKGQTCRVLKTYMFDIDWQAEIKNDIQITSTNMSRL